MKRRRLVPVFLSIAALATAGVAALPASACPPPLPGLTGSVPKSGETYPANAAVFLFGAQVSLDDVAVTVDGQPASLVPAEEVASLGLSSKAVLVDPQPAKGQSVLIEGTFCAPEYQCPVASVTFTAGAPDVSSPAPPSSVVFNVHDYPDFKSSGGDCQSDSDLAFWVHLFGVPASAGESPVIYSVEAFRDAGLSDLAFAQRVFFQSEEVTVQARKTTAFLNGAEAPEALCFRVTALDASGNEAAGAVVTCEPCHYKQETGQPVDFLPPAEPEWTAQDIYPGGQCDAGGNGAGGGSHAEGAGGGSHAEGAGGGEIGDDDGGAATIGGCGCQTGGDVTGGSALLASAAAALLAIAGRARRRGAGAGSRGR